MYRLRITIVQASVMCAALASATVAHAQATDPAIAAFFEAAMELMNKTDYQAACPKLEAVLQKEPRMVGARLQLARCYEGWGRTASAWGQYTQLASLDDTRAAEAQQSAARLGPRVAKLQIEVPAEIASIPGLKVTLDGKDQPKEAWGVALPVDGIEHVIEATAPDRKPWKQSIQVRDRVAGDADAQPIVIGVKEPEKLPMKPPPPPPPPPPIAPAPPPQSSGMRTVGFVGIGLGVVGLGAGAVLGGLALSKNDESKASGCTAANVCGEPGKSLRLDAITFGNASTAAFIAGGVLAGVGVILVATSGKSKESSGNAPRASLYVGPSSVNVRGSW